MAILPEYGPVPDEFVGKWNLRNLPPEGHEEVGKYFYRLFMEALNERTRLDLDKRMDINYRMYRGNHWGNMMGILSGKSDSRLSLALLSTNIQKTVANICAKAPTASVRCNDGLNDDVDKILQQNLDIWNNTEEISVSLQRSALVMEIYGITIEKAIYNVHKDRPETIVVDPYSFLPAPGYYAKLDDAPYLIHMQAMPVDDAEAVYGVTGLQSDESVFSILGEHREDHRKPVSALASQGSGRYAGNYVPAQPISSDGSLRHRRVLVIEIWIRDLRKKHATPLFEESTTALPEDKIPLFSPETGVPDMSDANPQVLSPGSPAVGTPPAADPGTNLGSTPADLSVDEFYYPGGIRKVTICNSGTVLDDCMNPNVNPELPEELVKSSYLYDHFPFFKANSYEDTTSLWGFSQCELTGDINLTIDKLWSNLMFHLNMALFPPLILPKDAKIGKNSVRYQPRLVLEPISTATAAGIKWLPLPVPPTMLTETLNMLLSFFDRISAMEDPANQQGNNAAAASAIQMLQERASLLIQAKIKAIDYLVRQRGRCAISLWQNFGTNYKEYIVDGMVAKVRGVDFVGRVIEYIVDSGSTVAKSGSQFQAQATQLFQLGAIDKEAVLKATAFPDAKKIIERMAIAQVPQALELLAQAGIPPEVLQALQQMLEQAAAQRQDTTQQQALADDSAQFGQQQGQGMQQPGKQGNGAAPATGSPGGAVGSSTGSAGAPSKPGVPKSQQG